MTSLPPPIFAHSLEDSSEDKWEPLAVHLALVGKLASKFAEKFGADMLGGVAGRLHGIGKMSAAFQSYIRGIGGAKGPDHATAGDRLAVAHYGPHLGRILAYCAACHPAFGNLHLRCTYGPLRKRLLFVSH